MTAEIIPRLPAFMKQRLALKIGLRETGTTQTS
jgi:hypothetical protein